jgi:hypothetical protein
MELDLIIDELSIRQLFQRMLLCLDLRWTKPATQARLGETSCGKLESSRPELDFVYQGLVGDFFWTLNRENITDNCLTLVSMTCATPFCKTNAFANYLKTAYCIGHSFPGPMAEQDNQDACPGGPCINCITLRGRCIPCVRCRMMVML